MDLTKFREPPNAAPGIFCANEVTAPKFLVCTGTRFGVGETPRLSWVQKPNGIGLLALFAAAVNSYNKYILLGLGKAMKKQYFLSAALSVCLLLCAGNGFAQRKPVKQLYKKVAGSAREYAGGKAKMTMNAAVRKTEGKTSAWRSSSEEATSLEALRRSVSELERLNARLLERKNFLEGQRKTKEAVFQAVPFSSGPSNTYSGTVFQTIYDGKREIYGVISTHALGSFYAPGGFLYRDFQAAFVIDGRPRMLPARVVQVSARQMTDVALVKFNPEDEAFLRPLTLAKDAVSETEVYSQGFACGLPMTVPSRRIVEATSNLLIKTTIPVDEAERAGLCGSAVLNRRHELVGIHTGSSHHGQDPAADVGYVAPAHLLRRLVAAYHNGGRALIPVRLKGLNVAAINVDEYISKIELLDANGRLLWARETGAKFSARRAEEQLDRFPQARFARLSVGRSRWVREDGVFVLKEDASGFDKVFVYDMINKKAVQSAHW